MSAYVDNVIAEATTRGWTPALVAEASYEVVAELAGVTLGPDNESPFDFHYRVVRAKAARTMRRSEKTDDWAERLTRVENLMRGVPLWDGLVARLDGESIVIAEEGD